MSRVLALIVCITLCVGVSAQTFKCKVTVDAGEYDREQTLVSADIDLPERLWNVDLVARAKPIGTKGPGLPAQIRLGDNTHVVCWIVPSMDAGETTEYRVTVRAGEETEPVFSFEDTEGEYLDCLYDGRPVTRLMYFTYSPDTHEETKKIYHHVFDSTGENLITKGSGGKFPHHRGIFVGWNKTQVGDRTMDFWHLPKPELSFRIHSIDFTEAGPVLGEHSARIDWCDPDGEPVIAEFRSLQVVRQEPPVTLLVWSSALLTVAGEITLGGDLHHAGVQYRAHNEVTTRESETSYLHPVAEFPDAPEIPWSAMTYALGESRFTVAQMNPPVNPEPTDYSDEERQYGRFGAFFTSKLMPEEPLVMAYQFYIVEGDPPTAEEIDAKYADFISPPTVTVK